MRVGAWPKACEKAREKDAADEKPVRAAISAIAHLRVDDQPPRRIEPEPEVVGARRLADRFAKDHLQRPWR